MNAEPHKLRVVYRNTADLTAAENNPRTHSPAQIQQIAASMTAFGWTNPILVDEHARIIAGHGRLLAAQSLAMPTVPTITLAGLDAAQRRALVIADNQLALNAGWDADLLRTELEALKAMDFDLSLIGFADDELAAWLAAPTPGLTDPDDVPEPPAEPVTKPGDVWLMGRHRLLCGDATSQLDVSLALAGVAPHLMVTDPPYGVSYSPQWRDRTGLTRAPQTAIGLVQNDDRADWAEVWALFPGNVAYIWHGLGAVPPDGFDVRAEIIWVKQGFVFGRGHYHWQHESCWYAVKHGATASWFGDRKQTTVWQIDNANLMKGGKLDDQHTGHSTQKPVECMRRPIENNSSPGQAVYDPFVGSGTTIIAAEMTGRACHAIEISPTYCDVAVIRWQNFTGKQATRPDGTPFAAAVPEPTYADS